METSENETIFFNSVLNLMLEAWWEKTAYIQSTYKDWDIINKNNIQAEVSVLKDLKMCLDGICKIEGFTTDELLTL